MKLRHYETMFLLHPDLSDEEREEALEKFTKIITNDGGHIVHVDKWPLKKLAYKVQKLTHGYYIILDYGAPGFAIQELTRNFRLDERVLKFITTKLADEFDAEVAAKRYAESEEKEAEPAESSAEASIVEKEES